MWDLTHLESPATGQVHLQFVGFSFSNKGVEKWSFDHYGLLCFADPFRDRCILAPVSLVATGSGPENTKICKNCIRYGVLGQNLPYLLRRQDHPPAPHPSSFPWQFARPPSAVSLSLSLSLFLSRDFPCERTIFHALLQHGCITWPLHEAL